MVNFGQVFDKYLYRFRKHDEEPILKQKTLKVILRDHNKKYWKYQEKETSEIVNDYVNAIKEFIDNDSMLQLYAKKGKTSYKYKLNIHSQYMKHRKQIARQVVKMLDNYQDLKYEKCFKKDKRTYIVISW